MLDMLSAPLIGSLNVEVDDGISHGALVAFAMVYILQKDP